MAAAEICLDPALSVGTRGQLEIGVNFICRSLGFQPRSFLPLCSDFSASKAVNFCLSWTCPWTKAIENHFLLLLPSADAFFPGSTSLWFLLVLDHWPCVWIVVIFVVFLELISNSELQGG